MGAKLKKVEAEKLYKNMLLVRRLEEKFGQLYQMGYMAGFLHLYIGEEAIAAGMNYLKKEQDTHITTYRCHAHALLQGKISPKKVAAEMLGKETGASKGKGGSMHLYAKENNFFGGHGIVGTTGPLGSGLALAHKYNKDNGVTFSYMGDGALPQGQVYEAFNMAALWKLPVIFIVENNQYAMGMALERTHANTDLYKRGERFNIPGIQIDAMDVMNVINDSAKVIEHVRSGKGPYIIEMKTYRYRGHSMSDPQKYRSKEEVSNMRDEKDPIDNFVKYAKENKLLSENKIKEISKEIKEIVKEAEDFAINSKEPNEEELYTDILK